MYVLNSVCFLQSVIKIYKKVHFLQLVFPSLCHRKMQFSVNFLVSFAHCTS